MKFFFHFKVPRIIKYLYYYNTILHLKCQIYTPTRESARQFLVYHLHNLC
nr:MAG TPA: hypothetical protein [Bacteriophage sp.]